MMLRVRWARWVCRRRGHVWTGSTVSWWQSVGGGPAEYHHEPGPNICSRCKEMDGAVSIPMPGSEPKEPPKIAWVTLGPAE